jgi:hypothetical protein
MAVRIADVSDGSQSTNGRWVHCTAALPSTAEAPFDGSQGGTTADPMITGFWRRSQDAAATPHSEEGAVDYHLALTLGGNLFPRRSAQAR